MHDIVKEFPGVRALDDVHFELRAGEVLALVGENGAGKSTLMKVLSGVYGAGQYAGRILRDGKEVHFASTLDAEKAGIAIIHQELNRFPDLTVTENLFMGRLKRKAPFGLLDWVAMEAEVIGVLGKMGVSFGPRTLVRDLSVGDNQMIEIARALMAHAEILIFDEPTSALSNRETQRLFGFIEECKRRGAACIYISHKLDEVYRLCNRAVVLRDGKTVGGGNLPALGNDQLVSLMVGREIKNLYPPRAEAKTDKPSLIVENLTTRRKSDFEAKVSGISFHTFPGEILGIGGMMGSGRTELFYGIFGHPDYDSRGTVVLNGATIPRNSIAASVKQRIGLVTEDRKTTGLHLGLTIRENISMASLYRVSGPGGLIRRGVEAERTQRYMKRLNIKAPSAEVNVSNLSGGNQQKVAIAKWSAMHPRVLMLDEPTRGVDVGARFEIYSLLREMALEEVTIIIASSDLPELIGICQRVLVLHEGRLAAQFEGADVTAENILTAAIGGS